MDKKRAFSKTLLIQESFLIWLVTLAFILLAFICVLKGYMGSLPWLSVTLSCPWAAYAVSQAMYYSKSKAENTKGGIIYDAAINQINEVVNTIENSDRDA